MFQCRDQPANPEAPPIISAWMKSIRREGDDHPTGPLKRIGNDGG